MIYVTAAIWLHSRQRQSNLCTIIDTTTHGSDVEQAWYSDTVTHGSDVEQTYDYRRLNE